MIDIKHADLSCFDPPPKVRTALHSCAKEALVVQKEKPESLLVVVAEWLQSRWDWSVQPNEIVAIPGIIPTMRLLRRLCPGRSWLQAPVYPPFRNIWSVQGPQVLSPPVIVQINPHNPTGRVATLDELIETLKVAKEMQAFVISDEAYAEFLWDGQHIPIASLKGAQSLWTITFLSPGKTFGLTGLGVSLAVVPNESLRQALLLALKEEGRIISALACHLTKVAYETGAEWLDEIRSVLDSNWETLVASLGIERPAATYVAWLEVEDSTVATEAIAEHGVLVWDGAEFGSRKHIRISLGVRPSQLKKALKALEKVLL